MIRDDYTMRMRMVARPEEPLQDLLDVMHEEQKAITDEATARMAEDSAKIVNDRRGLHR